jgi:hypothetical protein
LRITWIGLLVALAVCPSFANVQNKKLIEYGWDCPDTAYVRAHVQEIEKVPIDGIVIKVMNAKPVDPDTMGWTAFSKLRFKPSDYQHAIDDLKATKFTSLTDNFIQIVSSEGVDWFDPEWSTVAYNSACLAKVAKEGGCKGIMFDPEMYGQLRPYSYNKNSGHTLEESRAKARERGREFIRAINKEFPDITLLCLFGPSLPYLETGGDPAGFEGAANILLAAFYDGICEAATSRTTVVDGYEFSYGYRRAAQFVKARKIILEDSQKVSLNTEAFKKHIRAGFGIWADWDSYHLGWHPEDFSKNYFTPNGLRWALNQALEKSDRYVWVYSERLRFWDGATSPQEYLDAMRLAKEGPGPGDKDPMLITTEKRKAADMPGYSDDEAFAELRKTMSEIYDFPKDKWQFAYDDFDEGLKQKWYGKDFDDSTWPNFMIGKYWEEQGDEYYNGIAWYRKTFIAPKIEPGKHVFVAVGGADDYAKVWLNGKCVGEQHLPIGKGASTAFALDVTKIIKPGQSNVLAIRVDDPGALGGLWRSVKLMER